MPPASRDRRGGDRLRWLVVTVGLAVALGAAGAMVTVGFIKLLDQLTDLVWVDLPDALSVSGDGWGFLLPVCTAGGVLVGVCQRFLGNWPLDLETALDGFRRDRAFDYRHFPHSLVAALVALSFGGALGPEAALVAIIGGLGSWIAHLIGVGGRAAESVEYVGVMAALGTLFGTAGAAVLPLDEGEERGAPGRWLLLVPGLAAAGAGAAIFAALSSGDGYFEYHFGAHEFAFSDLGWAVVATAGGAILALVYLAFARIAAAATTPLAERPIVRGALGGLGLGLLASASALVLFSGHEGIQELIDDTGASTGFLSASPPPRSVPPRSCSRPGGAGEGSSRSCSAVPRPGSRWPRPSPTMPPWSLWPAP